MEERTAEHKEHNNKEAEIQRLIEERLPYKGYASTSITHFSKKDLDVLALCQEGVDYKIKLIEPINTLTLSPLYSMSLK